MKLTDIYDEDELNDDTEALFSYVPDDFEEAEFRPFDISHDDLHLLTCRDGMTSVLDAFDDYATPEQRRLVERAAADFDGERVIVLYGKIVVDGNHHVAAAHESGNGVTAIDLEREEPEKAPSP